jgi:hypothetical protein
MQPKAANRCHQIDCAKGSTRTAPSFALSDTGLTVRVTLILQPMTRPHERRSVIRQSAAACHAAELSNLQFRAAGSFTAARK